MNKFYGSYSILKQWESGNFKQAVDMYFGINPFTTRAMAEGKELHKQWEEQTVKNKRVPDVFAGLTTVQLKQPETELYLSVDLLGWIHLSGIIDMYDSGVIYEYKSGVSSSTSYANTMQPYIYQLLAMANDRPAHKAIICHYNQKLKEVDTAHIHLTKNTLAVVAEWVIRLSLEMHKYLNENNLYEQIMPIAKRKTLLNAYKIEQERKT